MRQLMPRGLTLIELMMSLAITAILAVTAAPFLGDYLANSRLREAGNTLYAEALFAQSEAQKRNTRVRVELTGSAVRTLDMSVAGGELLRQFNLASPVAAAADVNLDFASNGRPVAAAALAANLVMPGSTCSTERRCPGLRVDAGGAVRLCSDHVNACN